MKAILILTIFAFVLVLVAVYAEEKGEKVKEKAAVEKEQTICPITKNSIKKEYFVEYEGKPIYFCCDKYPIAFMKEPDKYMKEMKDKGINLEDTPKLQKMCPVMEMEVEAKYFADHDGKCIYFCCDKCPIVFKKDPAKYMKILKEKGVNLENAPVVEKEKPKGK